MDDLATLTAQPRPIAVDGVTYLVHPLTLADFGAIQGWVDAQYGDPLAIAREAMERFTVGQQKFLIEKALEIASRPKAKIGTPEADELIRSVDGVRFLLRLSIAKGRPGFGPAEAAALFDRMTPGQLSAVFEATNVDMVTADPKAPTPPGAAT